jgi:SAM-dependent MidA family methyltransferase
VARGGAALIVDYGPARSGPGDTLQGVARHSFADVLARPGEADLTAHVDFEALVAAASAAGACVHGPVPQGLFLTRRGLPHRIARLIAAAPNAAAAGAIRAGGARLVDPAAMGLLFKALAFAHPALPAPAGFEPGAAEDGRPT